MTNATVGRDCIAAAAAATRGFSGADLENLCRSAGVFAGARGAEGVGDCDLEEVMRECLFERL